MSDEISDFDLITMGVRLARQSPVPVGAIFHAKDITWVKIPSGAGTDYVHLYDKGTETISAEKRAMLVGIWMKRNPAPMTRAEEYDKTTKRG